MKKIFISMLLAAIQLAASASADITVASTFAFNVDAATSATYSSSPGSDAGGGDLYTADSPMTISTAGFTAAGTSKLVAVVSLHNSAVAVAPVTDITYGGVSMLVNFAGGGSPGGASSSRQMVFYLDNVATDGNLVLTWGTGKVDEVSVALFALNGAQTGNAYHSELKTGSTTLSSFNATQGDFLVGVGQRNNGTNSVAAGTGYTAVNLLAGNLNAEAAYKIATVTGSNSAPTFSNISSQSSGGPVQTMVAFAATPVAQVAVPDVVGLTQAAAESAITGASLTVGTVTTNYSPSVPSGDVISQNPVGGVMVNTGTSVALVVSLGPPPPVNVPDVVGLAQAAAESAITGASLTVGTVTYQNDAVVPAGDVISQNPLAGASVGTGSSVDLVVSQGPQPTVPDVVGLAQSAAQSAITGASLTVGTVTIDYSPTVPAGDVISQNPAAGVSVNTGSAVGLVVSLGANPAPGTIVDIFNYSSDFGPADAGGSDTFGAVSPITISTSGFTAAGSGKLVAVLSLHNSAAVVAPVIGVTYGGADLFINTVTGTNTGFTKNFIFYLDAPVTDGDFVITFNSSTNKIDEVGLQLFALNGLQPGTAYASESKASGAFTQTNAAAGDFVVGVAQRNNGAGTITVTNNPPYSEIDITRGNLTARVGYQVASVPGLTAPVFSGSVQLEAYAAFATASVSSAYDSWAATNAPNTGSNPSADEDNDGVTNGIEFVLGGTISTNDLNRLPAVSKDGTNMTFSFERAQQSIDPSVALSIEVGTNLATWPDVYPVPDGTTAGPPVTVEKDSSPGMDTVTLSVPMAPDVKKFARLKVTITP